MERVFLSATVKDTDHDRARYRRLARECLEKGGVAVAVFLQNHWVLPFTEVVSACRQRVGEASGYFSTVAADPERNAGPTPDGLAERLGLPPALLSGDGLHLAVPHLTDDPSRLAPQRAALHIDLDLGAPVRVPPEALAAEGDIADVIDDLWSHFGLGSPAVA